MQAQETVTIRHSTAVVTMALYADAQAGSATAVAHPNGVHQLFLPIMRSRDVFRATPISSDFYLPVLVTHAGDGRLFVLERNGVIKILHPDQQIDTFLNITDRVAIEGEQGLFNLVFDPDYATNGYFYVAYTGWLGSHIDEYYFFVSRFSGTGNVADPNSECRFYLQSMDSQIHNGGGLYVQGDVLYVGIGDDQGLLAAQEIETDKGKIITLDISNISTGDCSYVEGDQISIGLRNPWRFDFDPVSNDMYIGDVNDMKWEEVNFIVAGNTNTNFGWPCMEGPEFIGFHIPYQCEMIGQADMPIHYYPHHPQCAIIGGYVLRPDPQRPAKYIFGDACTREIFLLTHTDPVQVELLGSLGSDGFMLTSFGQGADGTIYAMDFPNNIYELNIPLP